MTSASRRTRNERGVHRIVPDAVTTLGPYVLHERLGVGGMATVHRAELRGPSGFRQMVALKQLHPHLAQSPEMVELFAHEARLGSCVRHANVAQTFDFGNVGETYFIAMEYVRGPTLAQVARQCTRAAGPIPFPIVLGILGQLCDGLAHIHGVRDPQGQPLGIVHRDVSPPNIIISNTGIVKLIDFGISKTDRSLIHTQTGQLKGKLGYFAPEYLHGQLDARADLFGLGVIAYEMLANQPLFHGRNELAMLTLLRELEIPPLSRVRREVPPELEAIVRTALEYDPDLRWQSAVAMKSALEAIARSADAHVGPPQILAWIDWAFSQRKRAGKAAPIAVSDSLVITKKVARPAVAGLVLRAHEISTVVVGPSNGSAVTDVFRDGAASPRLVTRASGDATPAPQPPPAVTRVCRDATPAPQRPALPLPAPELTEDDSSAPWSQPARPARAPSVVTTVWTAPAPLPPPPLAAPRDAWPSLEALGVSKTYRRFVKTVPRAGRSAWRSEPSPLVQPRGPARATPAAAAPVTGTPTPTPTATPTPTMLAASFATADTLNAPAARPRVATPVLPTRAPVDGPAAPVDPRAATGHAATVPAPASHPTIALNYPGAAPGYAPRATVQLSVPAPDASPPGRRPVATTGVVLVPASKPARAAEPPSGTAVSRPRLSWRPSRRLPLALALVALALVLITLLR